jgi:predicted lactoylglutathione lyase
MIGYSTVGTNDIARAATFYDALFATLGAKRQFDSKTFIAWGRDMSSPAFAVAKPYDGNPATVGNGVMIALVMGSPEHVDALYAKAMELGASDEGPPGDRGDNFYAAYFRDPDGNKLNAFCWNHG